MAKDTIIGVVNKLISKRLSSLTITDVVVGTFVSIAPYSISILNELHDITIPEELIDIDVIPADAKVGDKYRFLRYNGGNRFLLLGKPGEEVSRVVDYELLMNLPTVNGTVLKGNRNLAEHPLTNKEIDSILK